MRVLHFYSTYQPDTFGGAETAINQICKSTASLGVVPTVLTLSRSPHPKSLTVDGISVVRTKTNFEIASTRFSLTAPSKLNELVRQNDLIHYHFPWPFADICWLLLRETKPYVVTYHSDIVKQKLLLKLYSPLMHRFLSKAGRVIATSPNYAASSEILRKFRNTVSVVPLALSPENYSKVDFMAASKWRSKLGLEPFFLFVGVLRYYKGLHLLIEAVRGTNLRVVIVGAGPEEHALKRQSRDLDNIIFLGKLPDDDKIALLSLAYAFVFPSHMRSEAFGISLLEAGLFGLPSIAFNLGTGTSYVIEDEVTGILIERSTDNESIDASNAFRNAMQRLLRSPETVLAMGTAAKARVRSIFNVDAMGLAYKKIYSDLLK
jgi:O-antigen biosynthesis rhamnosyltransferase